MSKTRTSKYDTRYWHNEDGRLHRTDGPAIEHYMGTKEWFINGERHRTDGPACEYFNGSKEWWLDGNQVTESEFNSPSYGEFAKLIG